MIKQISKMMLCFFTASCVLFGCSTEVNQPVSSSTPEPSSTPSVPKEEDRNVLGLTEVEYAQILNCFESNLALQNHARMNGYTVNMKVKEDSILVYADTNGIEPVVTMKLKEDEWLVQYYFNQRRDFHYDHPDETDRLAYLMTDYYENSLDESNPGGVLICTLDVPESEEFKSFSFIYHEDEQKLINKKQEEILLTKDLREKVVNYCESFLEKNRELVSSLDTTMNEVMTLINLYQSSEKDDLALTEEQIQIIRSMFLKSELLQDYAVKGPFVQSRENMIMIDAGSREISTMVMRKVNGNWQMERHYDYYDCRITYTKENETRRATLKTDYYVNYPGAVQQNVLICRLDAPDSPQQGFNFIFDKDCQLFIGQDGDSMTFTNDLHSQLLDYCRQMVEENQKLDEELMKIAQDVIDLLEQGIESKVKMHELNYHFVTEGIDIYNGVKGIELLMDSDEIVQLNKKLAKEEQDLIAMKDVDENCTNMAEDGWRTIAFRDIQVTQTYEMIHLMICDEVFRREACGDGPSIQMFNIDVAEERVLTNEEFCERLNIEPETVVKEINSQIKNRSCKVEDVPGCVEELSVQDLNDWKITVLHEDRIAVVIRTAYETGPKDQVFTFEWIR